MNYSVSGRKWLWPSGGSVVEFCWTDKENTWTPAGIAAVRVEIQTEHLQNTQVCNVTTTPISSVLYVLWFLV